ncbi:MAG: peptidyl-prolyl cis-trans isomerase, partial [Myxococcota bacterium]
EEIETYLKEHAEMALEPEQVRVRQIVVKTEEDAAMVQRELRSGMTFEDAAMKYSLTPDGKAGGDLGFFARGVMPHVFDETCFGLKANELSKIIPSEYGFHLFKLIDRRPERQRPVEQVRDQIETILRREKERDAQHKKIEELRRANKIVIKETELARIH